MFIALSRMHGNIKTSYFVGGGEKGGGAIAILWEAPPGSRIQFTLLPPPHDPLGCRRELNTLLHPLNGEWFCITSELWSSERGGGGRLLWKLYTVMLHSQHLHTSTVHTVYSRSHSGVLLEDIGLQPVLNFFEKAASYLYNVPAWKALL